MFNSRSAFLAMAGLGAGAVLAPAAHASDFSGTKVGVHADYLWSKVSPSGFSGAGDEPLKGYDAHSGGAGVSISHDWQSGHTVFGVFGSITGYKAKGSTSQQLTVDNSSPEPEPEPTDDVEQGHVRPISEAEGVTIENHGFSTDLTALALFGGRVGTVVNEDTLLYAQAAVASGRLKIRETGDNAAASRSTTRSGYAVGVGVEKQLNDKWSVGVEYNHVDLGKASFTPAAYGPGKIAVRGDTVELGVKYRF